MTTPQDLVNMARPRNRTIPMRTVTSLAAMRMIPLIPTPVAITTAAMSLAAMIVIPSVPTPAATTTTTRLVRAMRTALALPVAAMMMIPSPMDLLATIVTPTARARLLRMG